MLTTALIWAVCLWASLCLGFLVFEQCERDEIPRGGDRLLLILWSGSILLGVVFLAISLLVPLKPPILAAVVGGASALALARRGFRRELSALRARLRGVFLLTLAALAGAMTALSVQVISGRDSMGYHYDITHWLSRVGTVPGLALVNQQFGYVSSWFALLAPFNHGALTFRVGAVANGLFLLLAAGHLQLVLYRVLRGRAAAIDLFMGLALLPVLGLSLLLNYTVSATPDFGTLLMSVVVPWAMMLTWQAGGAGKAERWNEGLLPLVLASAAVSAKITALPLLGAALLYYLVRQRRRAGRLLTGTAVSATVLAPVLCSMTVVTGCPLYPLPLCLDLPWTAPRGKATLGQFREVLIQRYRVDIFRFEENAAAAAGVLLAVLVLLWLFRRRRRELPVVWPLLVTGVGGMLFVLIAAPQARFGVGYIPLVVCAPVFLLPGMTSSVSRFFSLGRRPAAFLSLVLAVALTAAPSVLFMTKSERMLAKAMDAGRLQLLDTGRFFLPPQIPKVKYDDGAGQAFQVPSEDGFHPFTDEQGRGMFVPLRESEGVRFRHPAEGPRGGFEHRGAPSPARVSPD